MGGGLAAVFVMMVLNELLLTQSACGLPVMKSKWQLYWEVPSLSQSKRLVNPRVYAVYMYADSIFYIITHV